MLSETKEFIIPARPEWNGPKQLRPYQSMEQKDAQAFNDLKTQLELVENLYTQIADQTAECDLLDRSGYLYALQLINAVLRKNQRLQEPFSLGYDLGNKVIQEHLKKFIAKEEHLDNDETNTILSSLGPLFYRQGTSYGESYDTLRQERKEFVKGIYGEEFLRPIEQKIQEYGRHISRLSQQLPSKEDLKTFYNIERNDLLTNPASGWDWKDRPGPLGLPLQKKENV